MEMEVGDLEVNEYHLAGGGLIDGREYTLVRRRQLDGTSKWAVTDGSVVLNRDGDWEYEPRPSSRDDAFLARCRFDTAAAALRAWEKWISSLPTHPNANG